MSVVMDKRLIGMIVRYLATLSLKWNKKPKFFAFPEL